MDFYDTTTLLDFNAAWGCLAVIMCLVASTITLMDFNAAEAVEKITHCVFVFQVHVDQEGIKRQLLRELKSQRIVTRETAVKIQRTAVKMTVTRKL